MKMLLPVLLWVLLPGFVVAQALPPVSSAAHGLTGGSVAHPDSIAVAPLYNGATLAVLLANRPERFTEEEWLKMMQEPVNRTLFPLRITPGMLDTLDGREMDLRFRYMWMEE